MKGKKNTLLLAVFILFGFFALTKVLNNLSNSTGESDYLEHCSGCHGTNGEGLGTLIPPLKNADWLNKNLDKMPCIIKYGIEDSILVNGKKYNEKMLPVEHLSVIQIANISNYIIKSFTDSTAYFSPNDTEVLLNNCKSN